MHSRVTRVLAFVPCLPGAAQQAEEERRALEAQQHARALGSHDGGAGARGDQPPVDVSELEALPMTEYRKRDPEEEERLRVQRKKVGLGSGVTACSCIPGNLQSQVIDLFTILLTSRLYYISIHSPCTAPIHSPGAVCMAMVRPNGTCTDDVDVLVAGLSYSACGKGTGAGPVAAGRSDGRHG